jgi:hypothetical protein
MVAVPYAQAAWYQVTETLPLVGVEGPTQQIRYQPLAISCVIFEM